MERNEFIYGVEEPPMWFTTYQNKTEVNYGGFATVYLYSPLEESNVARMFKVNDTITYEDVFKW